MTKEEEQIDWLIKHVGCGSVDEMGKCPQCDAIREYLYRMQRLLR